MKLGVKGLITKDHALNEMQTCLDTVANDLSYISKYCHEQLETKDLRLEEYFLENPDLDILTKTELEVLKKVSENKTNKEIADEMFKSEKTIKNHRYNICQKLNLQGSNGLLEFSLKFKYLFM